MGFAMVTTNGIGGLSCEAQSSRFGVSAPQRFQQVMLTSPRHHCANKIHRLRQVTGNTSGKGKMYKNPIPTTPESIKDIRYISFDTMVIEADP